MEFEDKLDKPIEPCELYVYYIKITKYLLDYHNYRNYYYLLHEYEELDTKEKDKFQVLYNKLSEQINNAKKIKRTSGNNYFRHMDNVKYKEDLKKEQNKNYKLQYEDYKKGDDELPNIQEIKKSMRKDEQVMDNIRDNGNKWNKLSRFKKFNFNRVIDTLKLKNERIKTLKNRMDNNRDPMLISEKRLFQDLLLEYSNIKSAKLVSAYYDLFLKLPQIFQQRLKRQMIRENLSRRFIENGFQKVGSLFKTMEDLMNFDIKTSIYEAKTPKRQYNKKDTESVNKEQENKINDNDSTYSYQINDFADRQDELEFSEIKNSGINLNEDEEEEEKEDQKKKNKKRGRKKKEEKKKENGENEKIEHRWTNKLVHKIDIVKDPKIEKKLNCFNLFLTLNKKQMTVHMNNCKDKEEKDILKIMADKYHALDRNKRDIMKQHRELELKRYQMKRDIFASNYYQFPDILIERTIMENDVNTKIFLGMKRVRVDDA